MSKIRKSARGQQCQIRLIGICNHNSETVVLAHYRMAGTCGMGMKPSDIQAAYACDSCHSAVDGRLKTDLTCDELQTAFAEGVMRTQQLLIKQGLLVIRGNNVSKR